MTLIFLIILCVAALLATILIGLKRAGHRQLLFIWCIFVIVTTLFFGLKPKGYRFINQTKYLTHGNGIVFSNIGMIYSEKTLGEIGISDSLTILARIKPYWNRGAAQFLTIVDQNGAELFSVGQNRKHINIAVHITENSKPVQIYSRFTFSTDSARTVAFGIGRESMWLESEKGKKTVCSLPSELPLNFLEKGRLVIGYNAYGANHWHGELYRLIIKHSYKTDSSADSTVNPVADFTFAKSSGNLIKNQCSKPWDLINPVFPKVFKYHRPQSISSAFRLSQYSNHHVSIDQIINFLGFIPMGSVFMLFFLSFTSTKIKALTLTFLTAVSTSTSIEMIQIFIPTRKSQMSDILLNITGACIGAILILILQKTTQSKQMKNNI